MVVIAARLWGRPTAAEIRTLLFQLPQNTILRFNRPEKATK
jgi:hypothetical protein